MAVHSLTMRSMMPGQWPGDLRSSVDDVFQSPVSPIRNTPEQAQNIIAWPLTTQVQENLQIPRSLGPGVESRRQSTSPNLATPNTTDELFFDWPLRNEASAQANDEASSTSYLVFEPAVENESNLESTDWRRYDPPTELLRSDELASNELKSLLAPSIERIETRHHQEEERRAAASRIERPLARAGRASVRPRRQLSIDTNHLTPPSGLTGNSETSLSSADSGYGSVSPGTEPSRSPRSASRRSFGFRTIFKRKDRTIVNPEELDDNLLPVSGSREDWPLPASPRISLLPPPTREAPAQPSLTGECVSCLDDFATGELIKLTCHSYCKSCFQRLIANALETETHWPPQCCLIPIASSLILPHLSSSTTKNFTLREAERSIPASDRIYCSSSPCSAWIAPKHVTSLTHTAKCPSCHKKTCTHCRGRSHNGVDCPQDPALAATISLAEMEGWKRCYSCQALVEHNKGCRHMTCRCKAQFCYICGLKWRTCACTDAQLVTIQQRAETRRADENVRTARARQDAEEEEAAIRAVEEFMRAEEARRERELAAQRRREEAERQRREEARIAAVGARFRRLIPELEGLHDMQRVLMAQRYEFESEILAKERQDALDTLSLRHSSEQSYLANESATKISEAKYKFETEYTLRRAEERRIEEIYVAELHDYWRGKPDGNNKIIEARDELRRDQNKEYRFWDNWRRTSLQATGEGERRKLEALRMKQDAEMKAVNETASMCRLEWEHKRWAENRWVQEVVRERETMLGEMEVQEYAREL